MTPEREYPSTLSDNRVHIGVVNGRLEVTFEGGESSWGEALSREDTLEATMLLTSAMTDHHGWHRV